MLALLFWGEALGQFEVMNDRELDAWNAMTQPQRLDFVIEGAEANKAECKDMLAQFRTAESSGYFSGEQIDKIYIYLIDKLHKSMRARPYPTLYKYMEAVVAFSKSGVDRSDFDTWQAHILHATEVRKLRANQLEPMFAAASSLLNNKHLYLSRSMNWAYDGEFDFVVVPAERVGQRLGVEFASVDLGYYARGDTGVIHGASGMFFQDSLIWEGRGGTIYWDRTGLSHSEAYAELPPEYRFELDKMEFTVDSAMMYHHRIDDMMKGRIKEMLKDYSDDLPSSRRYPEFMAYDSVSVEEIIPNVNYRGDFRLLGARLDGYAGGNVMAEIDILHGDSIVATSKSRVFSFIGNSEITSEQAETSVRLGQSDSIYHPGAFFRYNTASDQITLLRDQTNAGKAPFVNSYHRVEMNVDMIIWHLEDNMMTLEGQRGYFKSDAVFESVNSFDPDNYRMFQMHDYSNRMDMLFKVILGRNGEYRGYPVRQFYYQETGMAIQTFYDLATKGYISFDDQSGLVTVLDKMVLYLEATHYPDVDYDVIKINSMDSIRREHWELLAMANSDAQTLGMESPFSMVDQSISRIGTIDLNTMDMNIQGVSQLEVSPPQLDAETGLDESLVSMHPAPTGDYTPYSMDPLTYDASKLDNLNPNAFTVTLEQDRNMQFDGIMVAGSLEFEGTDFQFDYDEFKMELDSVAFLRIRIGQDTVRDNFGKPIMTNGRPTIRNTYVQSVIVGVSGELLINDPGNKSGKSDELFKEFPIFESQSTSRVFYDTYQEKVGNDLFKRRDVEILGGEYNREQFYFEVDPFTVRDLGGLDIRQVDTTSQQAWSLPGTFKSTVFPDIEDALSIQIDSIYNEDFDRIDEVVSLGFERPNMERYPLYPSESGPKGMANMGVKLSNAGLRGSGVVEFMTSETFSDDFLFFPEEMTAVSDSFLIDPQESDPEYPSVTSRNAFAYWLPFKDTLYVASGIRFQEAYGWELIKDKIRDRSAANRIAEPFLMYEEVGFPSQFLGTLEISPTGLEGRGDFRFSQAAIRSDTVGFTFKHHIFDSDSCDFVITRELERDTAFAIYGAKAHIDFYEGQGEFRPTESGFIDFPINQYRCFMDLATWDMNRNEVSVGSEEALYNEDGDRIGSEYVSTHPLQDGLSFVSYESGFDVASSTLTCYEVDSINVADCSIFPDPEDDVVIYAKADIRPLTNAVIMADTLNRAHRIYETTVDILGKYGYVATNGKLDFLTEIDSVQTILLRAISAELDTVRIGNSRQEVYASIGQGKIDSTQRFMLSPAFTFDGNVRLRGHQELLEFDGNTSIYHACSNLPKRKLHFNAQVDPFDLRIPIGQNLKDAKGESIFASMFLSTDTTKIYSSFLSPKQSYKDSTLLQGQGFLVYNKENGRYDIADTLRLAHPEKRGTFMSLSPGACIISGEGVLDFGVDLGGVSLTTIGNATQDLETGKTSFSVFMAVNFPIFQANSQKFMAEHLRDVMGLDPSQLTEPSNVRALTELLPEEEVLRIQNEEWTQYFAYRKIPNKLNQTLVFTNVQMFYNEATGSFMSTGPISVGNIGEEQINKEVGGYIEIKNSRTEDYLKILLQINAGQWFYFQHSGEQLLAVSSFADEFVKPISDEKGKDKSTTTEAGEKFAFDAATEQQKKMFEQHMREHDPERQNED